MWSMITGWAAGVGIKTVFKWLLVGVVCVALVWSWCDYKSLQAENAALSAQLRQAVASHQAEQAAARRVQKRLKADLQAQAEIAAVRAQKAVNLEKKITKLRKIRRPENEKDCPVHPAILYAFAQLRKKGDGGKN